MTGKSLKRLALINCECPHIGVVKSMDVARIV